MADLMNLTMLICASAGSLVFGILTAYGILCAGFALLRPRSQPRTVKVQPETAQ
jgi:hypothetical protein